MHTTYLKSSTTLETARWNALGWLSLDEGDAVCSLILIHFVEVLIDEPVAVGKVLRRLKVVFTGVVKFVPIKHHPTIGDIISNRYWKEMFKIPKKGHLPTPVLICFVRLPNQIWWWFYPFLGSFSAIYSPSLTMIYRMQPDLEIWWHMEHQPLMLKYYMFININR